MQAGDLQLFVSAILFCLSISRDKPHRAPPTPNPTRQPSWSAHGLADDRTKTSCAEKTNKLHMLWFSQSSRRPSCRSFGMRNSPRSMQPRRNLQPPLNPPHPRPQRPPNHHVEPGTGSQTPLISKALPRCSFQKARETPRWVSPLPSRWLSTKYPKIVSPVLEDLPVKWTMAQSYPGGRNTAKSQRRGV